MAPRNPRCPLATLSREEAARALVKRLDGPEAARALGLSSPVTVYRAIARWPVHALTIQTIRQRLVRTI